MRHTSRLAVAGCIAAAGLAVVASLAVWPATAQARATSNDKLPFAVVDLWSVGYELAISDRYADEEAKLKAEWDAQLKPLNEELEKITEQARSLGDPDQPGADTTARDRLYEQYRDITDKIETKRDELANERYLRFAERLSKSCQDVADAAEEIAREEGYLYVLSSSDRRTVERLSKIRREWTKQMDREYGAEPDEESDTVTGSEKYRDVFDAERYRTVVTAPPEARIDDLVRDRLGLRASR
jgi:Skp family chaperone for outer membrane proteins